MGTRARPSPSRRRRRRDTRETLDAGRDADDGDRERGRDAGQATVDDGADGATRDDDRRVARGSDGRRTWARGARIRDDGARFERPCERRSVRT